MQAPRQEHLGRTMRSRLAHDRYEVGCLEHGQSLPLVVTPCVPEPIHALDQDFQHRLSEALLQVGGILLRGFTVPTPLDFRKFAASFGMPLASYEFGSTPRTKIFPGIYSSTEYPAHQSIPLHNEQSYTRQWPAKIWFHCITPAATGGATPIADSRLVFERLPQPIRDSFLHRELLYVRNYSGALDVTWQRVFNTDDRDKVEQYCAANQIECEWKADGELRTRQRCQSAIRHPLTDEWVWFNQAHLFHISSVEPGIRDSLLQAVGEQNLPRNVYFGDGSPIDDASLDCIRGVYRDTAVTFPWQAGDILMLDNLLVAHGRTAFTGSNRKIIVAMA